MPTPTFTCISIDHFAQVLRKFPFTRRVDSVHMHHTWRPRHADFRGHESIVSMWRHHTVKNGWSDIAQHITIDPAGMIWLGRNWNLPPASAAGHNGNGSFGPFMFEMIGDFDRGRDRFDGAQKQTALKVVALVQERFDLAVNTLRFHNAMSPKSCPGGAIDYAATLREVEAIRPSLQTGTTRGPVGAEPFPREAERAVAEAIRGLSRTQSNAGEPADAELSHDEREAEPSGAASRAAGAGTASRDSGLDPATLGAMRPHLVNLRAGRLSGEGETTSTPEDIDAIFEEHLPKALEDIAQGDKLRLVFFAHGGLVSESSGLQVAAKHLRWWRDNGVYPIYFVWETGLFETIGQLLGRTRQARPGARDLADFTSDPVIELTLRALQAGRAWGGMKSSAEHAVDAPTASNPVGGGAHYVATKLKDFCAAHGERAELHAVGHSAGSIFHSWFVPLARAIGAPAFKSVHFMAPAVRVDTFKERLLGEIGAQGAAESLTLYTMKKDDERKDHCAHIYRKSLLYLIHYALEDQRKTPILGLEESLRSDAELKRLFGMGAAAPTANEIVWSPTLGDTGRSASTSLSHGGFDDDAPTMNSIVRRILGKADAQAIVEYPAARAAGRQWIDEVDWPAELTAPAPTGWATTPSWGMAPPAAPAWTPAPASCPAPSAGAPALPAHGGRRMALCIGIDNYPAVEHQLGGCVNDAQTWARTLARLGFETRLLVDAEANRAAIERELGRLVDESRPGDVIVLQYAGHGTQVTDLDGDEDDGRDEALCPVDFASGALYIDDDLAEVLARIPDGVAMTCFMDCCHSGTNTRFAAGLSPQEASRPPGTRARYIKPSAALNEAHKSFRALRGGSRSVAKATRARMREVKFSACLDHEVALESSGSGEFTVRAMQVLASGIERLSNEEFLRRVIEAFGDAPRQKPMLDCDKEARAALLLQPLPVGNGEAPSGGASRAAGAGPAAEGQLQHAVHLLAQAVQALGTGAR